MSKSALIVIDMQCGIFTEARPRYDAEGLVQRLNALAARVRAAGGNVIFIQHQGPPGDDLHPSRPGYRLLPSLEIGPADAIIQKTACDAFLGTPLEEQLGRAGVEQVIITGCATDDCVDTTVRSALARGHETIVPRDGHTTADRPYLAATKIIEHHNAIWGNFISPAGSATLCLCQDIPAV